MTSITFTTLPHLNMVVEKSEAKAYFFYKNTIFAKGFKILLP
jgi:hypothetical protein